MVQRSTIDRILEGLNKGQDMQSVLTTTTPMRERPTPRFRGRTIVEELVGELADSRKLLNPTLVYDRQEGQWTYPDFFTPSYLQHAEEYRSPEVCTVVDVFVAAPEIETLEEMGAVSYTHLTLPTIYAV